MLICWNYFRQKSSIVLTSRADNKKAKLHSIALGVLLASKMEDNKWKTKY